MASLKLSFSLPHCQEPQFEDLRQKLLSSNRNWMMWLKHSIVTSFFFFFFCIILKYSQTIRSGTRLPAVSCYLTVFPLIAFTQYCRDHLMSFDITLSFDGCEHKLTFPSFLLQTILTAKNIIIATGGRPKYPTNVNNRFAEALMQITEEHTWALDQKKQTKKTKDMV